MGRIADLHDVREFLRATPPFAELDDRLLETLLAGLSVSYAARGTALIQHGEENHELFILRSGSVELRDPSGETVEILEPGESFGFPSLLTGGVASLDVIAIEDSLILHLDEERFMKLRAEVRSVEHYFNREHAARIRHALERKPRFSAVTVTLASLMQSPPVTCAPALSVADAAKRMAKHAVSSLLVMADDGALAGIVTDKDLRNRVLAAGVSPEAPIATIMTPRPYVEAPDAFAFDALLNMIRFGVHHLPVCDAGKPVGIVTLGDLMNVHAEHPVYFIDQVMRQPGADELVALAPRTEELFLQLAEADARFDQVGRLMTMVSDAFTRRLIALAEEQLGPPPCDYAWLALGSQARREQVIKTDQDNALVYADNAPDDADSYFHALAKFVCDGLDRCGYVRCPGDVMATNRQWRQPLARWQQYFRRWINEPEEKALMYAAIFFDLRTVHGNDAFVDDLKQLIATEAKRNHVFLATLTRNALAHEPPLGFLGQFVLQPGGAQRRALDLKHRGLVPVIDLARIHALAAGEPRVNTQGRLRAAAAAGTLNRHDAQNLLEAFELIGYVRLQHQAHLLREQGHADNFVAPDSLSPFQRRHLKDAFQVVRIAQAAMKNRWGGLT